MLGLCKIMWYHLDEFFPHLFFGKKKTLFPAIGYLSKMLVKKASMGLLNPVTSAQEKYLQYQQGSAELVRAVTGGGLFLNADHLRTLMEERRDGKKNRDAVYESNLKGLVINIESTDKRLLIHAKITGAWLSIRGTTVSGAVVSATEFVVFSSERRKPSPPS